MTNVVAPIADSTWAIITYEEAWKSYINSYVIKQGDAFVLIDSQLRKHRAFFQKSLEDIGASAEKIEYVYFTHRHPDHIGNADLFPSRINWIHLDDYYELDDFSQTMFGHTFTGSGEIFHRFVFDNCPITQKDLSPYSTRNRRSALQAITFVFRMRSLAAWKGICPTFARRISNIFRCGRQKSRSALLSMRKVWKFCWIGPSKYWRQDTDRF